MSHIGLVEMYNTWLLEAFPQPGGHLLAFVLTGTLGQFMYLIARPLPTLLCVLGFVVGLYILWRNKAPFHAILLVLPFGLACLGAILHLFPYGRTRHTAILDIAIAAGLGPAVASVARNRILPILMAAVPLILVWNLWASDLYEPVSRDTRQLSSMREAIQFLRSEVPSGSTLVTDLGTDFILGYYLGCPDYAYYDSGEPYSMRQCATLRIVVAPIYQFGGLEDLRETLSQVQSKYHLDEPVWVAAGGFQIHVANPVSDSRPFGKTIAVFRASDSPAAPAETPQSGHQNR